MRLFIIPLWMTSLIFVGVALVAVWKGGWRECAVSITQAVEMALGGLICPINSCWAYAMMPRWVSPIAWRPAADDGLVLVCCLICALRADRYWSIVACSFALLGEISDLTIFAHGVTRWAWLSASLVWSYAIAGAVLWGVLTRRRGAVDQSARQAVR